MPSPSVCLSGAIITEANNSESTMALQVEIKIYFETMIKKAEEAFMNCELIGLKSSAFSERILPLHTLLPYCYKIRVWSNVCVLLTMVNRSIGKEMCFQIECVNMCPLEED